MSFFSDKFSTENRLDRPVSLNSNWELLQSIALENQAFFDNDKRYYVQNKIFTNYTVNYDIIPNMNLNITQFLAVNKATFYDNPIIETEDGDSSFSDYIDTKSLALALSKTAIQNILHKVGVLRVKTGEKKLKFETILTQDVQYDYNLDNIIIRLKPYFINGNDKASEFWFEWYQRVGETNSYRMVKFTSSYSNKFNPESFGKSDIYKNMSTVVNFKTLPIVFFFSTSHKKPVRSNFVDTDLIMNLLLGFGLANAPSSLLVKIFIKTSMGSTPNQGDLSTQLGDVLDVLGLGKDDDVGKVDTGDLTALNNFFLILEKILVHTAQLEGMQRSSFTMAQQTRQSGVAKVADNKASGSYRNYLNREVNSFEDMVFETINKLSEKEFKFKNIDKSEFTTWSASETLDYFMTAATNGFESYITALAKIKKISLDEAEKYAEKIKSDMKKFYREILGENQPQEMKKVDGVDKGYLDVKPGSTDNIKMAEGDSGASKTDN